MILSHLKEPSVITYIITLLLLAWTWSLKNEESKGKVALITGVVTGGVAMFFSLQSTHEAEAQKHISDSIQNNISKNINKVTGNDAEPIIKILSTKCLYKRNSKIPVYLMSFWIANSGTNPINNIVISINDFNAYILRNYYDFTLKRGYFNYESQSLSLKEAEKKFVDYEYSKKIRKLLPGEERIIYVSGTPSDQSQLKHYFSAMLDLRPIDDTPNDYIINVDWDGGSINYFVPFKSNRRKVNIDPYNFDVKVNNKKVKDPYKYLKFDLDTLSLPLALYNEQDFQEISGAPID